MNFQHAIWRRGWPVTVMLLAALSQFPHSAAARQPAAQAPVRAQRGDGRGLVRESSATVAALPGRAKRYALVIGVDRYDDTQISTLGGASNDARSLAGALTAYAGFPADQVVLLASDQPEERQPTRGNILRRLSNLAGEVPKDGLLLVAFAGHGIERGGQAFLLPSDAQVSNDVELLEMTAINVLQVRGWVQRIGVRQVVMILDACRNDPAGRADVDNPLTESFRRGFDFDVRNREVEAFATLYATAVGRRAYEYREKSQGYFTWALVEGLRGAAANERGEVTLAALVKYLQDRVPKLVRLDLGPGKEQKPFAIVEGYKADELVIAAGRTAVTPARPGSEMPARPAAGAVTSSAATPGGAGTAKDVAGVGQAASPSGGPRKPAHKAGKVLLLIRAGGGDGAGDNALSRALSEKLARAGLSVTPASDLSAADTRKLAGALQKLRAGDAKAGQAISFAVVVTLGVSVQPRDPFDGLRIAELSGTVEAVDGDTGRTLAVENLSGARGFGNTQAQAVANAYASAGEKIPDAFVNRVAAAAR